MKEIVHRCIGERRKRYESADELIAALRTPPVALKTGALRSLKGVHLAFTGILSQTRAEAIAAARRAGAIVHGMPSIKTSVVVRGRPNAQQAAGRDGGIEADGDQAAARARAPDHAARRKALLEAGRAMWQASKAVNPQTVATIVGALMLAAPVAWTTPAGPGLGDGLGRLRSMDRTHPAIRWRSRCSTACSTPQRGATDQTFRLIVKPDLWGPQSACASPTPSARSR